MTKYNCGQIIGSLVHRAQGYKRLQNEVIASAFILSEMGSFNACGVVATNVVAKEIHYRRIQTLPAGSLVKFDDPSGGYGLAKVKLVDLENLIYRPGEVLLCSRDVLHEVSEEVWHLIAAVPSPVERVRIAKDVNLCKELCSIEEGSIVRVLSSSNIGIVTGKLSVRSLGPGIRFEVQIFENRKEVRRAPYYDHQYYSADELRLDKPIRSSKGSLSTSRNDLDGNADGMHCKPKKIAEKLSNNSNQFNSRLRPGDRIIWFSESGEQCGTICWSSSIDSSARVHLGDSECLLTECKRLKTHALPVTELVLEDEYKKRNNAMPQMKSKPYPALLNEVKVDNLLEIDQLDNCSTYRNSYGGTLKVFPKYGALARPRIGAVGMEISEEYIPIPVLELLEQYANEKSDSENQYAEDCGRSFKDDKVNDCGKYEEPRSLTNESANCDELVVGSVVEVDVDGGESQYGVIKWIGPVPYANVPNKFLIAGIEMEEESKDYSDGHLHGEKFFDCAPHRGHFTQLTKCKKDSRFQDAPYVCGNELNAPGDFGRAVIPGPVEPISQTDNIHLLCGKYKGIQGHNNSCYLDATLFSMFTFTSVFDSLLWRPPNENDIDSYEEVQRVLREEIVNPLRKNLYVRSDRVMNLRTLLDSLTSVTGLTCEEKDPEEFLTSLVAQVLKAEPFLKLSSGHEAYYYQLFVEKDERLALPTVQQLFEQSLITSDIKLKEVPSCLIIQMPRFGKSYKMYPRIMPSQILDVTDVIENSVRQCAVCGDVAQYECKECFKQHCVEGPQYCASCVGTVHSHESRVHHKYTPLLIPPEFDERASGGTIPRQFMELFAVLCIETSHYVAFVKCGHGPDTPWCFFDSMADRKGGLNGFNIPEMVLCPDLPMWLSDGGAQSFLEIKDDRHLPAYAKRLLCDAYMCMYQSKDVMMYR